MLALATPLLTIAMLLGTNLAYGFLFESRDKRQLQSMFGQYVPPELVDEMSQNASSFNLEGESRLMTVLFADIRGFTSISETVNPRELKDLLNRYFTPMTRIIHHQRGTIDKYVGDMIMSFWGAPLDDPDHARHGVHAAMEMIHKTEEMKAELDELGYPEIRIGVGLNTGPMNVGNMGSEFRMAYTVLGDAVNLGARLEGLTKNYGVNIIVNESTKAAISEYLFRELDLVRVKGKNEPVAIFEPLGHKNDVEKSVKDELSTYRKAMANFRAQAWDKAELDFFNLQRNYPDRYLYQVYLERITVYRNEPPGDDWDGVFTHTSK